MKITLNIPDGIIAGFFSGVEYKNGGMSLVVVVKESKCSEND